MFCTVTRWQLWRGLDDKRALGRIAARHLTSCARCQQTSERAQLLDSRLRLGVGSAPPPAPAQLSTATRKASTHKTSHRARLRLVALTTGLLASLVLFAIVYTTPPGSTPASQPALVEVLGDQPSHFVAGARRIEDRASTLLRKVVDSHSLSRSLDHEVANLRRDARHGLHYVLRVGGLQ